MTNKLWTMFKQVLPIVSVMNFINAIRFIGWRDPDWFIMVLVAIPISIAIGAVFSAIAVLIAYPLVLFRDRVHGWRVQRRGNFLQSLPPR